MGWRILVHSLRLVFGNLDGALRVSGVLTLVQFGLAVAMFGVAGTSQNDLQAMMRSGHFNWPAFAALFVLQVLLWLWVVVGWHRYILLNELPKFVPVLRFDRMMGYLGKSLLITLILAAVGIVLSVVAGVVIFPIARAVAVGPLGLTALMGLFVFLPVITIGLRLSTTLPGAAVNAGTPLFLGWNATHGQTGSIMFLALVLTLFSVVINLIGASHFTASAGVLAVIWNVVTQWIVAMVGVAVLTTLYGHFVERRELG
jgi:hypothetical protein